MVTICFTIVIKRLYYITLVVLPAGDLIGVFMFPLDPHVDHIVHRALVRLTQGRLAGTTRVNSLHLSY